MSKTVIKNVVLVDGADENQIDVVVDDVLQTITEIGENLSADHSIVAKGTYMLPGFVDLHSHLRQPGNEAAETIESGSRAAALGGYTAVVAMPNTDPCMDSAAVVSEVLSYAKSALCEVKPSAAITVGRAGSDLSPMGELFDLGVRMFTDDGTGVQDDAVMRTALEYAAGLAEAKGEQIVLSQHCEVSALSHGGVMHEGEWSAKLGLGGQPYEAEELMVARDIALAKLTGMNVHMQHLSSAGSVNLVRQAKAEEVPITAEATPHHFTLTDEKCSEYNPLFKVHPPLRTEEDIQAIKAGLKDGTIDAIATDHAPHTPDSKELPFDQAPPGMLGLETAFALANTYLDMSLLELVKVLSVRPAEIAGLSNHGQSIEVGAPANLVVIDPDYEWTIDSANLASLAKNCPFDGMKVKGKVLHTIYNGEVVVKNSEAQK